jgi:hypothetical protein
MCQKFDVTEILKVFGWTKQGLDHDTMQTLMWWKVKGWSCQIQRTMQAAGHSLGVRACRAAAPQFLVLRQREASEALRSYPRRANQRNAPKPLWKTLKPRAPRRHRGHGHPSRLHPLLALAPPRSPSSPSPYRPLPRSLGQDHLVRKPYPNRRRMEAVRASAAWVASRSSHVTVDLQGMLWLLPCCKLVLYGMFTFCRCEMFTGWWNFRVCKCPPCSCFIVFTPVVCVVVLR